MSKTIKKKSDGSSLPLFYSIFKVPFIHSSKNTTSEAKNHTSPVAHLLGVFWTKYLPKQVGF